MMALHHGAAEGGHMFPDDGVEEDGGRWYFSRREIEENSPSRRDGIDLKKETYLRKSYCTFLQDLGMRLKVPQVTIATAIIFCHRFFLRQSLAKNDRRTIATVCMFLAGKVEETPRPLKDVILVSYEIIHKRNPLVAQKIKQKEVYEQQKELILLGEKVVLTTLGFDFNVLHPYKPLVDAIKKFKVAQNALAQVAWNFVNDGLRTALSLQFEPHHIAAAAIFLAAKFLKVKLPSDGEQAWWQEFDVTPRQLQEVSNQMLELYEQSTLPPSNASEAEGSVCGPKAGERVASRKTTASLSKLETDQPQSNNHSQNHNPQNPEICSNEINNVQNLKRKREHSEHDHEGDSGKIEVGPGGDKEKTRAALERKKALGDAMDAVDELERELEDVELPSESKKIKYEIKQDEFDVVVEEGEVESFDNDDAKTEEYHQSPGPSSRKSKTENPLDEAQEGKVHVDVSPMSHKQSEHGSTEDRNGNSERDHKHENWA